MSSRKVLLLRNHKVNYLLKYVLRRQIKGKNTSRSNIFSLFLKLNHYEY